MTEREVPLTVFHYTASESLLSILAHRELWVADAEFLNDEQEMRYAADAIRRALRERRETVQSQHDPDDPATLRTWGKVSALLAELDERFPQSAPFENIWERTPFIASFCESGDLLGMWRGYASGGFSVEFDTAIMLDALSSEPKQYGLTDEEFDHVRDTNFSVDASFVPVEYGWDAVQAVVERLLDNIDSNNPSEPTVHIEQLVTDLIRIKHHAFAQEAEVRLVVFPQGDLSPRPRLRSGHGHLVPYHPIAFPHEAIRSICVGPSTHRARSATALRRWLKGTARGEWAHVDITVSDTPLLY